MTMFIGLDLETSASDIYKGAKLVQVGVAIRHLNSPGVAVFSRTVNPGDMYWEDEAAAVHNIPRDVIEAADAPEFVDKAVYQWLIEQGLTKDRRIKNIPVGFNVSGFDMPFVKQSLPLTHSLFSRRTADLNAICFALHNEELSADEHKKRAKEYAYQKIASDTVLGFQPHNAGWDAAMHIYCFEFLQKQVHQK